MKNLLVRGGVLAATGALVSGALLVAPAAQADPSPSSASATTWLKGQLTNGLIVNQQYGSADYGLSIDTGFAELASGDTATATQIRDAVAAQVADYISGDAFGDTGSTYAGAVAKALAYAEVSGATPTSYGGVDLVTRLESVTAASGRIADTSSYGDFANTVGQAYAAQGLATAKSVEAPAATSYLLRQQCPAGFFRLALGDAACGDNSAPDTDTTALTVLTLQSQSADPAVKNALDKAVAWLKSTQAADGSHVGGASTSTPNTNSTGLAAAALGSACQVDAANQAAAYVRKLQVPAGQSGALAGSVGAVAYDGAALSAAQSAGITTTTSDQFRRATSQGGLGLSWDPAANPTVQVTAPTGFVKGRSNATVTVTGAAAGERVCLTGPKGTQTLTGTGQPLSVAVPMPKKTADQPVTATTGPGVAKATVKVLGRGRLTTSAPKKVGRRDKTVVKLTGLGAKEKIKVLVDGRRVSKGLATKKGKYVARFRAPAKLGKHTLVAQGAFGNRKSRVTFVVTR